MEGGDRLRKPGFGWPPLAAVGSLQRRASCSGPNVWRRRPLSRIVWSCRVYDPRAEDFRMPFSPTALLWWGWLICALVLLFLSWLAFTLMEDDPSGCGLLLLGVLLILGAGITGVIGVVQLVKWAWSG